MKKLIIISTLAVLALSACQSTENNTNQSQQSELTEFTSEEVNSSSDESSPSYIYSDLKISGGANFSSNITLDNSEPYGYVLYANNSDYDAKLIVQNKEENNEIEQIIIAPHSIDEISWIKDDSNDNIEYEILIRQPDGELNGNFTLAKNKKSF